MGNKGKRTERGYIVVFGIFAVLVATVIYACVYARYVTDLNYQIATLNAQVATAGYYVTIPQIVADYNIFNWAIAAESAAFSIAAAAQASKKKSNNNYEYAEKFVERMADKYGIEPVSRIAVQFLASNPNNN